MAAPLYPFLPSVHLNGIAIGDKTGDNGVFFRGYSEPPVIPEFLRKRKVLIHQMASPGDGIMGNRVFEPYATNPNQWDWEPDEFELVTPAQVAKLRGYTSEGNVGYVLITQDAGVTVYLGLLAEDYPLVRNYRYNLQLCHAVRLKVHVLGQTVGTISE